jgi:hypothetical protein
MRKNVYSVLVEPSGELYTALLDYALLECKYFILVTEERDKQLNIRGKKILAELSRYMYRREVKSEWPGTVLLSGTAVVITYYYVQESAEILKKNATSLYQWQIPDLPDDLCLLREDESPWLVTIAHESDSYFVLDRLEILQLQKAIPGLVTMLENGDH